MAGVGRFPPPRGRRLGVAVVAAALLISLGRAAAIDVTTTTLPLAGSQFQGADGNQDNAPGLIDWQGLRADGRVRHTADPNASDDIFSGGSKEDAPDHWGFTTHKDGSSPSSGNILDSYGATDRGTGGDAFLYLAFTREASNGTVFVTFELNQEERLWTNSKGERVPCRTTGDILISFEPHGSGATVQVERWVTDSKSSSGCAESGHLVNATNLQEGVDVQGSFNNGSAAIPNYLPGSYSATIPELRFGEAAINLSRVLAGFGHGCPAFASTWMHSRSSSSSENAELKDYVAPSPFAVHPCKATPALSSSTGGTLRRHARRHRLRRQLELGAPLRDTAHLTGVATPTTSSLTFRLYGPNDAHCSGTPVFESTKTVTGDGYYGSGDYTATAAGVYRWVVAYSGDQNNEAAGPTKCGIDSETVAVSPATPSLSTTASGTVKRRASGGHRLRRRAAGEQPIWDVATLSGGARPTGTIKFRLYGPDDSDCSGDAAFTSDVPVNGNGPYMSESFTPTAAGVYRWVAAYSGDANNTPPGPTACGEDRETVVVFAQPTLATFASQGVTVGGGDIFDTAVLSGALRPTGHIDFELHGPGDSDCNGTPVFKSSVSVSRNGPHRSDLFTPTTAGTYRWVATYPGDDHNRKAGPTPCDDAFEEVVVAAPRPQPVLTTTALAAAPAGSPISDTAHLGGGNAPTGHLIFILYGPADDNCLSTPAFAAAKAVSGNGDYTSASFVPTKAGVYNWVATYTGDAHNQSARTNCGDSAETVTIAKGNPTIDTHASRDVTVDGALHDTANLQGGSGHPRGTITFQLFGPNDVSCSGTRVFSAEEKVTRTGLYRSPSFEPAAAGTYRWVASYSGDANNQAAASSCNATGETATVNPARPHLGTAVRGPRRRSAQGVLSRAAGRHIHDTAFLIGGAKPTGEITFQLYGPDDGACTGPPVFTTATTVNGAGIYNSERFAPTAAGSYRWVARYSGDANNRAAGPTRCGARTETVKVTLPATPLVTSSASAAVTLGAAIHDTAHLTGGSNPGGAIRFTLYGPGNDTCTGAPTFSSTVAVAGNGDYDSASFTPTVAGAYHWRVSYSGDRGNHPAGPTSCLAPSETAVVRPPSVLPATTNLTSSASAADGVGAPISDVAHLADGIDPAGAITFELYGPDDLTCSAQPAFTDTETVTGNGDYESAAFVPTLPGSYRWVASYSGDANNSAAGPTACGDPTETVSVAATPGAHPSPGPNAFPATVLRPRQQSHRPSRRHVAPRFTG